MAGVFQYDNKVFRGLGKVTDCFIVSMFWILGCIPVVTFGASCQALYHTVHKQIKGGRGYVWQEFFDSYKDELKSNIGITVIFEVILGILAYERMLLRVMIDNGGDKTLTVMYMLTAFLQLLLVTWALITFCYRARFAMDWKNSMKNGILLMLGYLPRALVITVSIFVFSVLIRLLPFLICFLPVIWFLLYEFLLEKVFRSIMRPEDAQLEEEQEMESKRDNV